MTARKKRSSSASSASTRRRGNFTLGAHGSAVNGVSCAGRDRALSATMGDPYKKIPHVVLWEIGADGGKELARFGPSKGSVCWMAKMSPAGRTVAAGFGDLTLRLFGVVTNEVRTLETPGGIVASLAWSADGRFLFTGNCGDKTVRLWDVNTGTVVAQGKTKRSGAWIVAMNDGATRAVSGRADKLVHVWDPRSGEESAALAGHAGTINGLAMSADGKRAFSASQDGSVRVWDLDAGKAIGVLKGHKGKVVNAVACSPSGDVVASAGKDGTIRLWSATTMKTTREIMCAFDPVTLDLAPDSSMLIAGGGDGGIRILPVA